RDPLMLHETKIGAIYGLVSLMDNGYHGAEKVRVPALVLYGKKDQLIPPAPVRDVAQHIPSDKRFLIYAKGYHMLERDLQAENVFRDIEAWIASHDGTLSSLTLVPPAAEEVTFPPLAAPVKPSTAGE